MFTDAQLLLSDAQALTIDARSTNVINLSAIREIAQGKPVGIAILVNVAAIHDDGDETYEFQVHTDDNAAFTSATTLSTTAILYSVLTAGALIVIPLSPAAIAAEEQYLSLYFNGGGTTPTITITAWVTPLDAVAGRAKVYADGITIS